jgi:hypothetical protein
MTSPGKSVAPAGIGVPFSFASFPIMLAADAAGALAGVAPKTCESKASPQIKIPARKRRQDNQDWRSSAPWLLEISVYSLERAGESVFIVSTPDEAQVCGGSFHCRAAAL